METTCKSCGSCGMPLQKLSDYACGDISSLYCSHCTHEDGQLKSYEEILESTKLYLVHSQGIEDNVAYAMAKNVLSTMPAWKMQEYH